ncbi:site-specific DNA-methyltransferase [Candidatus Thiodictyon syntrophicum]|jgi:adenine-specific DNA-methyltransferase|uniref:site-specific DNA-methyltransferase (adenine-specific) n=2 Tax=Candidatus Thiodictyon syntrophicum TaxID=1166950 RepID=A0A2K8UAY1_9GAMM|nr:site-specific DNA-methyltransferase [Candidatus Thiodictyon syntrophicum]
MAPKSKTPSVTVATLTHDEATRRNIPTAEYQSVMQKDEQDPVPVTYARGTPGLEEEKEQRNRDLDPQLVWRGKDQQDWSDLIVQAPPLYIQEKVHPKVLIDDLLRHSSLPDPSGGEGEQFDLFADFNGVPKGVDKTEFYRHDQNWSNRMILGDSLQVMASLAEREGLRGKVQCIYLDPPYGIKFNSNFQWSTTSRDVKDGNVGHITREPEQVKAFRDTWRDGIHSYLTYLRDRLTVARDLLTDSGSIFVQIGDENVHRVRALMDEVFGDDNFCGLIAFATTSSQTSELLSVPHDFLVWFAKSKPHVKFRKTFLRKEPFEQGATIYSRIQLQNGERFAMSREDWISRWCKETDCKVFALGDLSSQRQGRAAGPGSAMYFPVVANGREFFPGGNRGWSTTKDGIERIVKANRYQVLKNGIMYVRMHEDYPVIETTAYWMDTASSFSLDKVYVVQTNAAVVQRAFLISTDPGDLVLDPTCGSGTTAYVAEQWGRRWITIDTSRVALALARARIMGARYPYYLLADSHDGQIKEAEVARTAPSSQPTRGDIRHGFVYERVPHITLKSIANNTEIDTIWDKWQAILEPLREDLNAAMKKQWQEWEIPRAAEDPWPTEPRRLFDEVRAEQAKGVNARASKIEDGLRAINKVLKRDYSIETLPERPVDPWPEVPAKLHADWWQARIDRQKAIDASIAAKADSEYLYDKPYTDNKKVRVAGPFTVESLSPHRVLGVDENDELIDPNEEKVADPGSSYEAKQTFPQMILENLKVAGVQQAHKEDRITFTSLTPWPGGLVCADGRYIEGGGEIGTEKRAAIFIGPEFGTVTRADLVAAAREAGDADFDCLIACAFNYEAHATEFSTLGRIPVLKARMNADLHMAEDLKNTGKGNLFVIFGEPDIAILPAADGQVRIKINGVDVFHPSTGEVRSDGPEGIACWFIDTDYNEESFFVRHAYFLGAADPYKALKITLKAEINEDAWATLNSDTSRPFPKPASGRIAVKIINHLGDEVMKVFRVG